MADDAVAVEPGGHEPDCRQKTMSTSTLIWGVIFGSIGLGFFVYGKKQGAIMPLLSGIGLMAAPCAVSNAYELVFLCLVLIALPFVVKI